MRKLLVAAAMFAASVGALAGETIEYSLNGTFTDTPYCGDCTIGGVGGYPPYPGPTTTPWTGEVTITIPTLADGQYYFGDVVGATLTLTDSDAGPYLGNSTFQVVDDQLTSFSAQLLEVGVQTYNLAGNADGGAATIVEWDPAPHHGGVYSGTAVLTPIPEPETWALLGLGLIGVGVRRRFHRQHTLAL